MTPEQIERLKNLSIRANEAHVIGHGSADVTIFATDFYALEEAINILEVICDHV